MIIISWSSLKLGHAGSKTRSIYQILKNIVYTLKGSVLIQNSCNCVRLLIIIVSRSGLKLGHVISKTRSLGQILEKPYLPSRRHSLDLKLMKLCQKLKLGQVGSEIRLLGQILEKLCVHSRGHSFNPKFMKLRQNVNHRNN